MKKQITIFMYSSNMYFLLGMRHIFEMYFRDKGTRVVFSSVTETKGADLMINSCSALRLRKPGQMRITLRRRDCWGEYVYQQRTFSQDEKPENIALLVDELFDTSVNELSQKMISTRISRREKEVLREMVTGSPTILIAKKLQISIKTVSAHKRSAMCKLGFRNSLEMYICLLGMKSI